MEPTVRTEFLVPNLHCPSCVSHIKDVLSGLEPTPSSITSSLVSHTVSVSHSVTLEPAQIQQALTQAGYFVDSVIQNGVAIHLQPPKVHVPWTTRLLSSIHPRARDAAESRIRETHTKHCKLCQDHLSGLDGPLDPNHRDEKAQATEKSSPELVGVSVAASPSSKLLEATVSITGMTCSSCVGAVTEAVREKPWVQTVNVNLLTSSAVVRFEDDTKTTELLETIENVGYDATLEDIKVVSQTEQKHQTVEKQIWMGSFSISGMSCSSCVGKVTKALEQKAWIREVNVNLLNSSATVHFEGKEHAVNINAIIEGLGYESKLIDLIDTNASRTRTEERSVSILVEGMFCGHCPQRIADALNATAQPVAIQKFPSLKDPIMTVSYTPNPPDFTIRDILASICAAHKSFKPTIYHPPSLEDRARAMHARERLHTLYRVALSVSAAIPSFIIGIVFMSLVPKDNKTREYLMRPWANVSRAQWSLFIISTPVYFFAADMFHRRALKGLYALWRPGSPTPLLRRFYRFGSMDLLMSLGTSIAYFASIADLIVLATLDHAPANEPPLYFDSVVFLSMFLLIGRLLEAWSKAKTGDAVTSLGKLRPTEAILATSTHVDPANPAVTRRIPADTIEIGDLLSIAHGASPPCDGLVLDGTGRFNESSLTGESRLITKSVADNVYSGTINEGGPIVMRTTQRVGSSMLDDIIRLVREGQTRRAPIERVADQITGYFVPLVTLAAIATWLIWLGLGVSGKLPQDYLDVEVGGWPYYSLQFAIAVFVIACPCGIGLAAPTALFVGGGLAAKYGILVKGGGEAFQEASGLDVVVFDKTGTLTEGGNPSVTDHQYTDSDQDPIDKELVQSLTRALEEQSSHPLATAIVSFLGNEGRVSIRQSSADELPGRGMKGTYTSDAHPGLQFDVLAGNERILSEHRVEIDDTTAQSLQSWKRQGKSVVLVAVKVSNPTEPVTGTWRVPLIFGISDPVRPESAAVINALQKRGISVWMISGDNEMTANAVGQSIGIPSENIIAGVLPEQKAEKIRYLQRSQPKTPRGFRFGHTPRAEPARATVAMVGDGINDSPALTVADVGIAIGSGSEVAISSAAFVIVSSNLSAILILLDLSRKVFTRIKLNFGWALVYNLVALPVAAGVLYPIESNGTHVKLDPVWASLAMALSSMSVVASSLALKTKLPFAGFNPPTIVGGGH